MAKSEPTQPTQTTTPVLTPEQQQLISLAMPGVRQFAATVPQRYQGTTIAPTDPSQTAGQEQLLAGARNAGDIAGGAAANVAKLPSQLVWDIPSFAGQNVNTSTNVFSDPGIWNPAANPGLTAAIDAAQRPLYQNLTEQVLPQVRGEAVTTGNFGSSRQGIAEGLAAGRTAQAAGDVGAKLAQGEYEANLRAVMDRYNQNLAAENQRYATNVNAENARLGLGQQRYASNIDAILKAAGLTPTLQAAAIQPGLITSGVGDVRQQYAQQGINQNMANWNYDQLAPFLQSRELLSLVQGLPGAGTQAVGNVPRTPLWQLALGGAGTGAAVGSAVGGPLGAGIGAAGGATLPFLFG